MTDETFNRVKSLATACHRNVTQQLSYLVEQAVEAEERLREVVKPDRGDRDHPLRPGGSAGAENIRRQA